MFYSLTQLKNFFDLIKRKIKKKNGIIHIYCSYEVDSICSAKILSNLFTSENISYKIIPINGYNLLQKTLEKDQKVKNLIFIFMINCGGRIDLMEKLDNFEDNKKIKIILLDSHRPLHHRNVEEDNKRIILIDDNTLDKLNCPKKEDLKVLEEVEENEENFLEFDEEEEIEEVDEDKEILEKIKNFDEKKENREDIENGKEIINLESNLVSSEKKEEKEVSFEKKEKKIENLEKEKNPEKNLVLEEEEQEIEIEKKRLKRKLKKKINRKKIKDQILKKIDKYYNGSYTGKAITDILYNLCRQLNKENNNLMWLWVLGLTDQFLSYRINKNLYEKRSLEIQKEVIRLNINKKSNSLFNKRKNFNMISLEKEINLILLKYWNLYDSLMFSNYTIPKLKSWHEQGKNDLNRLIAKLGIPLTESKQLFKYLSPIYKDSIKEKIINVSDNFDFSDILITTFSIAFDNKNFFNSLDFCFLCNNVLNCPENFNNLVLKLEKDKIDKDENLDVFESNKEENFWTVYHHLLERDIKYIKEGITYSIENQKNIVNTTFDLISKNAITNCSSFRYVILSYENFSSKIHINHLLLEKISNLIIKIKYEIQNKYYEMKKLDKKAKMKPLVICILNKKKKSYYVLGVNGIDNNNLKIKKNSFGNRFKNAAEKAQVRYSCDFFESSMIEIHEDDFESFMDSLIS